MILKNEECKWQKKARFGHENLYNIYFFIFLHFWLESRIDYLPRDALARRNKIGVANAEPFLSLNLGISYVYKLIDSPSNPLAIR